MFLKVTGSKDNGELNMFNMHKTTKEFVGSMRSPSREYAMKIMAKQALKIGCCHNSAGGNYCNSRPC